MDFSDTLNIDCRLLGFENSKEKVVTQNSNFLKNLGKPRPGAFIIYRWDLNTTFLFSTLGRPVRGYAIFLRLKNGIICSKIEPFLKCGLKIWTLMSIMWHFLISKKVLMVHMHFGTYQRVSRMLKQKTWKISTTHPSLIVPGLKDRRM